MRAAAVPPQPFTPPGTTQPIRIVDSPFGPQDPIDGGTVPSPAYTEEPMLDEPRSSRAVYVVLAIGVLLVLGALAVVVGGW